MKNAGDSDNDVSSPSRSIQEFTMSMLAPPTPPGRPLLLRPLNFTELLDGNICAKVCFPPTTLTSLFVAEDVEL